MTPTSPPSRRPLARRLVLWTLLASGFIATFITAAQLYLEYDREMRDIQLRFLEIESAYLPSVRQGLWVMDRNALQALVNGMQQLPDFEYAAVLAEDKYVATSGAPPESRQSRELTRVFEIDYTFRGADRRIGTLEVTASDAGPLRRTWQRLGLVLALNSIKAGVVAMLILFMVQFMITRPILRIHRHTQRMAAGQLDEPLVLEARYPSSPDDEIHELAATVEAMRVSLGQRNAELLETNRQLEETVTAKDTALIQVRAHADALELAAGVFAHTFEGIMITDANNRILSVNPAFTTITGYTQEEAVGQTPRLLRSHHQDEAFYRDMWASLSGSGEWVGELWNRRKNGEAYLQWTSITTITDAAGKPYRRISVMTDITEARRKDEHIRHLAYHDALTNLPNRMLLQNRLEHAIKTAEREAAQIAVLFIDLDRFKVINDSLGHFVGDKLLLEAARRLTEAVRVSDTVSRQGGDEFVILAAIGDITDVVLIAEKITASIGAPFDIEGQILHVGASIGISVYPQDGADASTLLRNADVAMYAAKEAGRRTFRFFDNAMNARARHRLHLEAALRRAVANDEFELFYQPKVCLSDSCYCGMEALIRWRDPELGLISPLNFIPLAEEIGLIGTIGDWVLDTACSQRRRWLDAGRIAGPVAINVSARQLDDPQFADKVQATLRHHGLEAQFLQLEVTESTVMNKPEQAIAALAKLAALGVTIAVDDFGTGYSSFSYLKRLPIHLLKVDRSFVSDIGTSREDEEIVTAIIQVAKALKLQVVAEGVETQGQADFLRQQGCHYAQGYLYARPLPVADFERLVGT
ncbi:MAG: EAL domain-containing protein [Rhodocyclaceae bacterium]|nr:EAL domain-containing protein [Rhodocyclaceae bacterium]